MTTYKCNKCRIFVNATYSKCHEKLVNNNLELDNGSNFQISKCSNDHCKIKSPSCHGQDRLCAV